MFSNEHYAIFGFSVLQMEQARELWDKVGKHYGLIPSDFISQMVTHAEFEMEEIWNNTKNTDLVFKGLCEYLEELLTYNGITYN